MNARTRRSDGASFDELDVDILDDVLDQFAPQKRDQQLNAADAERFGGLTNGGQGRICL
ncbi:hypothetical protein JMG10_48690, partial [Nostoc ellipsosporum NOK]|nr:hypothetical protein [Nostoc ellipsosporum NOK]